MNLVHHTYKGTVDGDGDVAELVRRQTRMLLRQVRFPDAARDFSPRVNCQRRISFGVRTALCAVACINICAHVKNPKRWQPCLCFGDTKIPHTLLGMGSAALAAAVAFAYNKERQPKFPRRVKWSAKKKKEKKNQSWVAPSQFCCFTDLNETLR